MVVQRWMLRRLLNLILGVRRDSTGEVLLILSWEMRGSAERFSVGQEDVSQWSWCNKNWRNVKKQLWNWNLKKLVLYQDLRNTNSRPQTPPPLKVLPSKPKLRSHPRQPSIPTILTVTLSLLINKHHLQTPFFSSLLPPRQNSTTAPSTPYRLRRDLWLPTNLLLTAKSPSQYHWHITESQNQKNEEGITAR